MYRLLSIICFISIFLTGCDLIKNRQYSYIGNTDNKHIFLNNSGKIIFTDHNFEVIAYNDLHRNFENISNNKYNKLSYTIDGYNFEISTRYYDNKLLYIINLNIIDDDINLFTDDRLIDDIDELEEHININNGIENIIDDLIEGNININVVLTDNLFELETITTENWEKYELENGYVLQTKGNIPINRENYKELNSFYIIW